MMKFEDIDLGLEKIVFLLNAEEGNPGIYELTWELSYYNLTIEDKYKVARIVLNELISDDLVVLERFKDYTLTEKLEIIDKGNIENIINNPSDWYPCNEILSISLTTKGNEYLLREIPKYSNRITDRLLGT